jgi:3',5'-cyclic AMP phosphodiesterase CpdA
MKLLLLHLSDIHFKESEGQNPVLSRTEQIAAAAASTAPSARCCFVVVTGDIAFSGKQAEYAFADKFFSELRDHLYTRLPKCDPHFVLVPGNHDCDFSQSDKVREFLVSKLAPENFDESIYSKCTEVQGNYEEFAVRWEAKITEPVSLSKMYRREAHDLSEGTVEFRLINSAWMSTEKERQGSLLFPVELLRSDEDASEAANLVVTILHHPYNWFETTNARDLRNKVEATSDIILTGHEHEGDFYRKDRVTGERTEYLEGLVLQDSANLQVSLFNVLVIDLVKQTQEVHIFCWGRSGRYEREDTPYCIPFQRNRYRLQNEFILNDTFKEFLKDPEAPFTHPEREYIVLDDLFVYPDLRQLTLPGEEDEWPAAVVRGDQVLGFVLNHRHVLLIGAELCGKTALSKVLFQDLRTSGFVPIYVSGSEFKGYTESSVSSTVERSFEKTYAFPNINGLRQLECEKRAIIVDDFHGSRANAHGRDLIINTLESLFGIVVLLSNEQLRFDDLITEREQEPAIWHFIQCEILPFGHLRRADLVEKWYFLGRRYTHDEDKLFRRAVQAEKTVSSLLGNNFIPSYPIFILVLLQQMEARTPIEIAPTSGSYGFLYESLLTIALARSSKLDVDLDTQYNYLSEFAYLL